MVDGHMTIRQAAEQLLGNEVSDAAKQQALEESEPLWLNGSGPLMPKIIDYVLKTSEGDVSQPFEFGLRCESGRVIKIEPGDKTLNNPKMRSASIR